MSNTLSRQMRARPSRDDYMIAVEARVADVDDLEGMHRVRVVVPMYDENEILDEWIPAMQAFTRKDGYGAVFRPEIGSEVLLFGRFGERHTLFYMSRYNEERRTPSEFDDGSCGFKLDTAFKVLGDQLVLIVSAQSITLQSPLVTLGSQGAEVFRTDQGKSSFHGATAIARRTLPPPASDLASCITLANAIRQFLVDWGACQ